MLKNIKIQTVILDEVHLFQLWGLDKVDKKKQKKQKAFRPLLSKVCELAIFKSNFGLLSATVSKASISTIKFNLLRIKKWKLILRSPNRDNLRFFMFPSKNINEVFNTITKNIKEEKENFLESNEAILINVFSMEIGYEIYTMLMDFLLKENMLLLNDGLPNKSSNRRIAFVNSLIAEDRKKEIVQDITSTAPKLKLIVATSALGTGVDMKVRKVYSLGLPSDEASFLQIAGRAGRSGNEINDIIYFYGSKFSKIPSISPIRELYNNDCIRETFVKWFINDYNKNLESHLCCSCCMVQCIKDSNCSRCKILLHKYNPACFTYEMEDKQELINLLSEEFGSICIGKLSPNSISPNTFVNSVIEMEPRVDSPNKLIKTFDINEKVAELTFNKGYAINFLCSAKIFDINNLILITDQIIN